MRLRTRLLVAAAAAIPAAVLGWFASNSVERWIAPADRSWPSLPAGSGIGGPFQLTDHRGNTATDRDFLGRIQLVFFGFTNCPDACPTALSRVSDLLDQLGPASEAVRPLFVTVDPERDTPQRLSEYVAAFHPSLVGLTGSAAQVADAARVFRVYYRRVPGQSPDDYTMDHTASVFILDRRGRFRGTIDLHGGSDDDLEKLRRLLDEAPTS